MGVGLGPGDEIIPLGRREAGDVQRCGRLVGGRTGERVGAALGLRHVDVGEARVGRVSDREPGDHDDGVVEGRGRHGGRRDRLRRGPVRVPRVQEGDESCVGRVEGVVAEVGVGRVEIRQVHEGRRYRAFEPVAVEGQALHVDERAELGRDRSAEPVPREVHVRHIGQVPDPARDRAFDHVRGQGQAREPGQVRELGRELTRQQVRGKVDIGQGRNGAELAGIGPVSWFDCRKSIRSSGRSPSSAGIEPVSRLSSSQRVLEVRQVAQSGRDRSGEIVAVEGRARSRLDRLPSSAGIGPLSRLAFK